MTLRRAHDTHMLACWRCSRRKAKERQQRLMADFANKRKQFMEQNKEEIDAEAAATAVGGADDISDGRSSEDRSSADASPLLKEKLFDCVICNVPSASTDENPIGLVGLLQATSGAYSSLSSVYAIYVSWLITIGSNFCESINLG